MMRENTRAAASGYLARVVLPALTLLTGWWLVHAAIAIDVTAVVISALVLIVLLTCYNGFFMVHPNQAKVLQLLGSYAGSVRLTGLRWANRFYSKTAVSLRVEVQDRLDKAGVEVIEARISHLAYAPEIASAMLKRQQAQAIVAARTQIVDGAVGMVRMALTELEQQGVVDLDPERRANMASNLLVVLCGEENARPVLNTGSLYN